MHDVPTKRPIQWPRGGGSSWRLPNWSAVAGSGALCLLSAFIKLFGIVGLAMFAMVPALEACRMDGGVGVDLGCVASDCGFSHHYAWLVERYGQMLSQDHSESLGYSLRHSALLVWPRCLKGTRFGPGQRAVHCLCCTGESDRPHAPPARSVLDVVVGFGVQPQSESPPSSLPWLGWGCGLCAPRTRLNLSLMWFALIRHRWSRQTSAHVGCASNSSIPMPSRPRSSSHFGWWSWRPRGHLLRRPCPQTDPNSSKNTTLCLWLVAASHL